MSIAVCPSPPTADYIIASGSLPPGVPDEFYARIAEMAKELEVRFVVDTKGDPLRAAVQQGVYLIKPNMRELGMIVGHEIKNEQEQEDVARSLVERGQSQFEVNPAMQQGIHMRRCLLGGSKQLPVEPPPSAETGSTRSVPPTVKMMPT